jgi:predicted GNAT superfamily acetyltransferase
MSPATETQSVIIRDIESVAEMRAIEDLQIEAWGDDERDIVPLNQFSAALHVGGSLIGAFDSEKLVGFVYGFYGHIGGRVIHHSHMLAVLPAYRNHNLAFRLKLAQRTKILADDFTDRITWTFDPLQSVNAHFNFGKLGVVSDTYKVNVYGEAGASFLHQNGTDRFFVTWLIDSRRVEERIAGRTATFRGSGNFPQNSIRLLTNSNSGVPERPAEPQELSTADSVLIEIPADINSIERANFDVARKWREESRHAFSEALSEGFVITEYLLKNDQTGNYLLEKKTLDSIS